MTSKAERNLWIGGLLFSFGVARLIGDLTPAYEYSFENFSYSFFTGVAIYVGLWLLLSSVMEKFREVKPANHQGPIARSSE